MQALLSLATNNVWSLVIVAVIGISFYILWRNRNSVKDAVFDIIMKMPKGDSQQGRTPKPVLQRVAESTHKSDGQEGQHTE